MQSDRWSASAHLSGSHALLRMTRGSLKTKSPARGRTRVQRFVAVSAGGKPGVEIVHVQRGPTAAGGLTHYLPHQIQCLTKASGEGVLDCEWRRFTFTG